MNQISQTNPEKRDKIVDCLIENKYVFKISSPIRLLLKYEVIGLNNYRKLLDYLFKQKYDI